MPAITISREIGSLGNTIAEQTAKRLGYQLVDKNTLEKVFIQYGFVDFKEAYDESGFWARFEPRRVEMMSMLNRVIETMVYHGNIVLLGRGGFALLKGYADVLNVRIQAPFPLRVKRMMSKQPFASQADAENFVRESDRGRQDFVNSMYAERWDSISAFDLVIDTGKISAEQAVAWLETTTHQISQPQPGEVLTTRTMNMDPVMVDAVNKVLNGQFA